MTGARHPPMANASLPATAARIAAPGIDLRYPDEHMSFLERERLSCGDIGSRVNGAVCAARRAKVGKYS
jgi:hypothetical protein